MLYILLSTLSGKYQSSCGNLTVATQAARLECVIVEWMSVGMTVCVFSTHTNSESGCGIDSLSQSWTNPKHLLWAYGLLTLSQSCLPLVCLWDCKLVSAPKFMYGFLRTCSCDVIPQSSSIYLMQKYLFQICSLVVIQYQDLCLMITLCGYGACTLS